MKPLEVRAQLNRLRPLQNPVTRAAQLGAEGMRASHACYKSCSSCARRDSTRAGDGQGVRRGAHGKGERETGRPAAVGSGGPLGTLGSDDVLVLVSYTFGLTVRSRGVFVSSSALSGSSVDTETLQDPQVENLACHRMWR